MVLRFRDLVTAPGETIKEHDALIQQHGYVWWGWWNKPEERTPRNTFATFTAIARKDGLRVFLAHSGDRALYQTSLADIVMSATEDPIKTPEPGKTPPYYGNAQYKAWLKLAAPIEPIDPAELRNWSYEDVEELGYPIVHLEMQYQRKRVESLDEMLDRKHRTIYFITPYAKGTHTEGIVTLEPTKPPDVFCTELAHGRSNYVVQFSDLHFGPHHNFPAQSDGIKKSLAGQVIDDLRLAYNDQPPAAVILTGDLTWQGTTEEFTGAATFIAALRSAFSLGLDQFVVVPGNHDIQWADTPDYDPNAAVTRAPAAAEANYREFYRGVFGVEPSPDLAMARRLILRNYVPVDIVGLNSCRLEQKHFAGFGFVGSQQLVEAAQRMGWSEAHGAKYRFVALHHHVVPIVPQEEISNVAQRYSLTLDAGELLYRALRSEVDLVCHGHMHQPASLSVSRVPWGNHFPHARSVAIHAAGSVGVKTTHLGPVGKNAFTVYFFEPTSITMHLWKRGDNVEGFERSDAETVRIERNPAGGCRLAT